METDMKERTFGVCAVAVTFQFQANEQEAELELEVGPENGDGQAKKWRGNAVVGADSRQ